MASILDSRIIKVADHIRNHPANRISQEDAATLAGLTPAHFRTLFRSVTGEPFRSFALRIRLEHAQALLAETEMTIQQIAGALGYSDVYLFSRQFKEQFGLSPTNWRHHQLRSSLTEGRIVFEQGVVELVCKYATHNDFDRLAAIVAHMSHVTNYVEATQADAEFHGYLVTATHNAAIQSLQSLIRTFFAIKQTDIPEQTYIANLAGTWNAAAVAHLHRQHQELLDVICTRNVNNARGVMRDHILAIT